jgi:hypothetical protein
VKKSKIFILTAIVLSVVYLLFSPPHYSWRQKLTVSVTTPRGPVEGSAVTQVDIYDLRRLSFGFPEALGTNSTFSGEAVPVEITPGRFLFVLLENSLHNGGPNDWPAYIWYKSRMTLEDFMARIKQQSGK